jgi:deoxyribonuclease V
VDEYRKAPWPDTPEALEALQLVLSREQPTPWSLVAGASIGGCFVCFERGPSGPGRAGDRGWAAAACGGDVAVVEGAAGAPYERGLLALREGPLLEAAVRALAARPDALLVNASGRDHPRHAGLALHLGAALEIATVGVTHRTLLAEGEWPPDERGALSPLRIESKLVGYRVRTRRGTRPLAVHAAWRTDPETAVGVVLASVRRARTPEPLRLARRAARAARASSERRS